MAKSCEDLGKPEQICGCVAFFHEEQLLKERQHTSY